MQQHEFDRLLADPELQRVAAAIKQIAQPAVRLATSAAVHQQPGTSRLGGAPDVPAEFVWPTLRDQPLAFLAQFRLADFAKTALAAQLPASGMLWFFYDPSQQTFGADPNDRAGWQVLFHEDGALTPTPVPTAMPPAAHYKAAKLSFLPEITLPSRDTLAILDPSWQPAELDRYEQLLADAETQAERRQPHHQLLGHPDQIQDEMHTQVALVSNGMTDSDDPRAADALKSAANWQLLLQLDSDPHTAMAWGSAGKLYFWIEQAALAAHRFDKTWCILQSD